MAQREAVVVGGGFAGITAALALHDAGRHVTLFEREIDLGGRCGRQDHPNADVDVGHHLLFRGCTTVLRTLGRLGLHSLIQLQPSTSMFFARTSDGTTATLRSGRLEAPNHLVGSMLAFPYLDLKDKVRLRRVVQAMRDLEEAEVHDLDTISFGDWLRRFEQTTQSIESFWTPLVRAGLNVHTEHASAAQAILLFQQTLFDDAQAYDAVTFVVPLSVAMREMAARLVEAGIVVRSSVSVTGLHEDEAGWKVTTTDGAVHAHEVVLAIGAGATRTMLRGMPDLSEPLACMSDLNSSPRVAIHLFYSAPRPSPWPPFAFVIDHAIIDLIVHRSTELAAPHEGHWISVLCNDAARLGEAADEALIQAAIEVVERLWPTEAPSEPERSEVVRSMEATFAPRPGSVRMRQGLPVGREGLAIAGDWTWTRWPSSIEGACRSGLHAAARLADASGGGSTAWDAWPAAPRRGDEGWPEWSVTPEDLRT
jgi:squalene-associated FAD-dependent desaturase